VCFTVLCVPFCLIVMYVSALLLYMLFHCSVYYLIVLYVCIMFRVVFWDILLGYTNDCISQKTTLNIILAAVRT
jgi:hypothetical protein